jgi:hypothetical protein
VLERAAKRGLVDLPPTLTRLLTTNIRSIPMSSRMHLPVTLPARKQRKKNLQTIRGRNHSYGFASCRNFPRSYEHAQ